MGNIDYSDIDRSGPRNRCPTGRRGRDRSGCRNPGANAAAHD
jgi:hypothetical protein